MYRKENFSIGHLQVESINGIPSAVNGTGNNFYLAPADSATSYYKGRLVKNGVKAENVFSTFASAYSNCAAYSGDTIWAYPGSYEVTAEVNLTKDAVNVLGVSNGNVDNDIGYGGINFYNSADDVVRTWDVTAKNCLFSNFRVANAGTDAHALGAVFIRGASNRWIGVNFQGAYVATPAATDMAYSLCLDRGADSNQFEDCVLGNYNYTARASSSHLLFNNSITGTPLDGSVFKRCRFLSISVTAACASVRAVLKSVTALHLFEDCVWYNFYVATNTRLNQVFLDEDTYYTHAFLLRKCTAVGYHEWQDSDIGFESVQSDMPIVGTGGGMAKQPTGASGS